MTTRELFWRRGLGSYTEQDAVDWALHELANRAPTANLAALAGAIPPYNAFEVEDLLRGALREIGAVEPPTEQSFRDYVCTMAGRILRGEIPASEGCRRLATAHGGDVSRVALQAFWLLQMAIDEDRAEGFQYYDLRFNGQNFEELVTAEVQRLSMSMCTGSRNAV